MMGYWDGMGAGAWIAVAILWLGVLAVVVWLVVWGVTRSARPPGADASQGGADEVLDRRFASGELDAETYRAMRDTLREARSPGQR